MEKKNNSTFGARLTNLRCKQGLTTQELAIQIGCTKMSIYRWERDEVAPSIYNAWDLADFFGVSVDYLIGRKGE